MRKATVNIGDLTAKGIGMHIAQGVVESATRLEPHAIPKEQFANQLSMRQNGSAISGMDIN